MTSLRLDDEHEVPVRNGQCLLEDISLARLVEKGWWVDFDSWLRSLIQNTAGDEQKDKVIHSDRVPG